MTWSYSGDPTGSDVDSVRFEVGDTDATRPLVQDEEIAYALSTEGGVLWTAAAICLALAARFARDVDRTMGRTGVVASQRAFAYRVQAKALRVRATSYAVPVAGGLTQTDRQNRDEDLEEVKPAFTRELHEDKLDLMPTPSVSR